MQRYFWRTPKTCNLGVLPEVEVYNCSTVSKDEAKELVDNATRAVEDQAKRDAEDTRSKVRLRFD